MSDFSNRLKQTLDERGCTQRWLADAAETKEATISRYISGVAKSPQVDILVNIARALDVSTDYLLGLSNVKKAKASISPEEQLLLSCFRKASDRDISVIWQLFEPYMTPSEKSFLEDLTEENESSVG